MEVVVTDDPAAKKLRVHLIAYNSTPQTTPAKNRPFILPGLVEDVPIFHVTVETAVDVASVEPVNPSTTVRAPSTCELAAHRYRTISEETTRWLSKLFLIDAMKNGKDVYCEKPETLTIREGRKMTTIARRFGRVFSGGSQREWGDYNWFHKMVRGGMIGDLQQKGNSHETLLPHCLAGNCPRAGTALCSPRHRDPDQDGRSLNATSFEIGANTGPLQEIDKLVFQLPTDSELRGPIEQKLLASLDSDATTDAKRFLCQQLRVIGTEKCVPSLANLLTDPQLSHMAWYALGRLEVPAATEALLGALDKTSGDLWAEGGASPRQKLVKAKLLKGWNGLMLKSDSTPIGSSSTTCRTMYARGDNK